MTEEGGVAYEGVAHDADTNGEEEHGDQGGDDVGPAVEAGVTECQVAAVLKVLIASPAQDRS